MIASATSLTVEPGASARSALIRSSGYCFQSYTRDGVRGPLNGVFGALPPASAGSSAAPAKRWRIAFPAIALVRAANLPGRNSDRNQPWVSISVVVGPGSGRHFDGRDS